jgi:hypothetical protein
MKQTTSWSSLAIVSTVIVVGVLAPVASAHRQHRWYWTESKAEARLHTGYRVADPEEVREAQADADNSSAELAGLIAEGASPATIAAARGRLDEALHVLRLAKRGHALAYEFCTGIGQPHVRNYHFLYKHFSCRGTAFDSYGSVRVLLTLHVLRRDGMAITNVRVTG